MIHATFIKLVLVLSVSQNFCDLGLDVRVSELFKKNGIGLGARRRFILPILSLSRNLTPGTY